MTDNEELDPRRLTFSQAQGYEPIPGPLALGLLSEEARIRLWDCLVVFAWCGSLGESHYRWRLEPYWRPIFQLLNSNFLLKPIDEFTEDEGALVNMYRPAVLHDLPLNKVFDLFQMIMRHQNCPSDFTLGVATTFERFRLAYVVDTEQPVTILPAVTEQEGETIIGAIKEFREAGIHGTETHLKKAGELVNGGDWAGAVRESINAVESVARLLAPDANTLGPALAALERGGRLHSALRGAFDKLYGYTSDEEGIRHPLIENATSPVGQDEAVFMLGACASFASYLWRRHQAGS